MENNSYTSSPSQKRFLISRRSFNFQPITLQDYFQSTNVSDTTISLIFEHLTVIDRLNAMATCKRFYLIGSSSRFWKHIDVSNITISQFALHRLLERQTIMARLTSSMFFKDSILYPHPSCEPFNRLSYLDLSYVVYSDSGILNSLLERSGSLEFLNIAQFPQVDDILCSNIARNKKLQYLNMEMCSTISTKGMSTILAECNQIIELNLGWSKFSSNSLKIICQQLPICLRRLNLSGMRVQFRDEAVEAIVMRCKKLIEIDFSDSGEITKNSIEFLKKLEHLEKLSLCRCHEIEPLHFVSIDGLDELNLHGCITEEGVRFLRMRLNPTRINQSALSNIARLSMSNFRKLKRQM